MRFAIPFLMFAASAIAQPMTPSELAFRRFPSSYTYQVSNSIPVTNLNSWVTQVTPQGIILSNNTVITESGCIFTVGPSNLIVSSLARWTSSGNQGAHPIKLYGINSFVSSNVVASYGAISGGSLIIQTTNTPAGSFVFSNLAGAITLTNGHTYALLSGEGVNTGIVGGAPDTWWAGGYARGGSGDDNSQEGIPCLETSVAVNYGTWFITAASANDANPPFNHIFVPVSFQYTLAAPPSLPAVSNVLLWVEGSAGLYSDLGTNAAVNGSSVALWQDQSGNGNHLEQTVSANQPTLIYGAVNGYPAVRFSGSAITFMTNDSFSVTTSVPVTAFVVFRINSVPGSAGASAIFNLGSGTTGLLINNFNGTTNETDEIFRNNVPAGVSVNINQNDWRLETVILGSASEIRTNGVTIYTTTLPASASGPPNYLSWSGSQSFLAGDVAEFLVYSRALSSTEITNIESYLTTKYNLP